MCPDYFTLFKSLLYTSIPTHSLTHIYFFSGIVIKNNRTLAPKLLNPFQDILLAFHPYISSYSVYSVHKVLTTIYYNTTLTVNTMSFIYFMCEYIYIYSFIFPFYLQLKVTNLKNSDAHLFGLAITSPSTEEIFA